ncbi:MAG: alpha-glucan family phosphorylase [Phycisphaeraceae bacterium]
MADARTELDLDRRIAYFSMEVGLSSTIPTYAGGLGILAGDTIRAAADLRVPMVAVTLVHRLGNFRQVLDEQGWQHEEPVAWPVETTLTPLEPRVRVHLVGRDVLLRAWLHQVKAPGGCDSYTVPVIFLDADLPENNDADRQLTHYLYGGDRRYRLCQEVILGVGGVRMLGALGFSRIERFHMNEGHAALLTAELLREHLATHGKQAVDDEAIAAVRGRCVFTTHTPVPAGHDRFTRELVRQVVGEQPVLEHSGLYEHDGMLNLTYAGLNLSHYVNGVAKRHGEVSQLLFAPYVIDAITNGVHAGTWTGPAMAAVFDGHIPEWRADNFALRYAAGLPLTEIAAAHRQAKQRLIDHIHEQTGETWDVSALTIGYARRATAYKRPDLLFSDVDRLKSIAAQAGGLQLVYSGKAHPEDETGKRLIQKILGLRNQSGEQLRLVYLPDYNIDLALLLVAGVDVWLNTPRPPLEASGTSGMKAALNGVPSLSILDGWWLEGCIEGVTGWAIGPEHRNVDPADRSAEDAAMLYDKLEQRVVPVFRASDSRFLEIRRHCIALNGSFFNTHRMLQQYVLKAYF